jgi:glycosidase
MDYQQLKNKTIYQIYVRNHTQEGTFQALIQDLPRIKDLGVEILYLLPIHPIGVKARKGTLGSPYSIKDYYKVNEELGDMDDLQALLNKAHEMGFKVMMDIVFNHTSRDATWVSTHPEYYFYKDGKLSNRIGDWSDIADLDLTRDDVQTALIDVLLYWTKFGFDGYRCDVAPIIPLEFWAKAKLEVAKINSDIFWLAESVHPQFIEYLRGEGFLAHSDAEMYQVFDISYDYDVESFLKDYLKKQGELKTYLRMVEAQGYIYPSTYVKAHFLENHDLPRIHKLVPNVLMLKHLTAWSFFQNGIGFLFAGQETLEKNLPSLFDKDTISLSIQHQEFYQFIKTLVQLKKRVEFSKTRKFLVNEHPLQAHLIEATIHSEAGSIHGIFNLSKDKRDVYVQLSDGMYFDLISQKNIEVAKGILTIEEPLMLKLPS